MIQNKLYNNTTNIDKIKRNDNSNNIHCNVVSWLSQKILSNLQFVMLLENFDLAFFKTATYLVHLV